jgi:hypothetical protein
VKKRLAGAKSIQGNLGYPRRNKIAHEGDRLSGRNTGKRLREIKLDEVLTWNNFIKSLVKTVDERAI